MEQTNKCRLISEADNLLLSLFQESVSSSGINRELIECTAYSVDDLLIRFYPELKPYRSLEKCNSESYIPSLSFLCNLEKWRQFYKTDHLRTAKWMHRTRSSVFQCFSLPNILLNEEEDGLMPEESDWFLVDVASADRRGLRLPVDPPTLLFLGSSPSCDIQLLTESIEKKHSVLTYDIYHRKFKVKDLNSKAGTFVNGSAICSSTFSLLNNNDTLQIGNDPSLFRMEQHIRREQPKPSEQETHSRQVWTNQHRMHPNVQYPTHYFTQRPAECSGCLAENRLQHTCGANDDYTASVCSSASSATGSPFCGDLHKEQRNHIPPWSSRNSSGEAGRIIVKYIRPNQAGGSPTKGEYSIPTSVGSIEQPTNISSNRPIEYIPPCFESYDTQHTEEADGGHFTIVDQHVPSRPNKLLRHRPSYDDKVPTPPSSSRCNRTYQPPFYGSPERSTFFYSANRSPYYDQSMERARQVESKPPENEMDLIQRRIHNAISSLNEEIPPTRKLPLIPDDILFSLNCKNDGVNVQHVKTTESSTESKAVTKSMVSTVDASTSPGEELSLSSCGGVITPACEQDEEEETPTKDKEAIFDNNDNITLSKEGKETKPPSRSPPEKDSSPMAATSFTINFDSSTKSKKSPPKRFSQPRQNVDASPTKPVKMEISPPLSPVLSPTLPPSSAFVISLNESGTDKSLQDCVPARLKRRSRPKKQEDEPPSPETKSISRSNQQRTGTFTKKKSVPPSHASDSEYLVNKLLKSQPTNRSVVSEPVSRKSKGPPTERELYSESKLYDDSMSDAGQSEAGTYTVEVNRDNTDEQIARDNIDNIFGVSEQLEDLSNSLQNTIEEVFVDDDGEATDTDVCDIDPDEVPAPPLSPRVPLPPPPAVKQSMEVNIGTPRKSHNKAAQQKSEYKSVTTSKKTNEVQKRPKSYNHKALTPRESSTEPITRVKPTPRKEQSRNSWNTNSSKEYYRGRSREEKNTKVTRKATPVLRSESQDSSSSRSRSKSIPPKLNLRLSDSEASDHSPRLHRRARQNNDVSNSISTNRTYELRRKKNEQQQQQQQQKTPSRPNSARASARTDLSMGARIAQKAERNSTISSRPPSAKSQKSSRAPSANSQSRSQSNSRSTSPKTHERELWNRRKSYDPRQAIREARNRITPDNNTEIKTPRNLKFQHSNNSLSSDENNSAFLEPAAKVNLADGSTSIGMLSAEISNGLSKLSSRDSPLQISTQASIQSLHSISSTSSAFRAPSSGARRSLSSQPSNETTIISSIQQLSLRCRNKAEVLAQTLETSTSLLKTESTNDLPAWCSSTDLRLSSVLAHLKDTEHYLNVIEQVAQTKKDFSPPITSPVDGNRLRSRKEQVHETSTFQPIPANKLERSSQSKFGAKEEDDEYW
ncbi:DgyrCDS10360 [Dimorphilus gyrociliatus]|uniref:DgyrCDS10360 n=1 Tax=Dimorphilus gyrociliatus TaxID=2664684 RepID=A0A7I8VZY0_9ANNE|nr:DgyrCDS10360 [Dimorphilus gyrociliatus]